MNILFVYLPSNQGVVKEEGGMVSSGSGCGSGKCTIACCFHLPRQHSSLSLSEGEEGNDDNNTNNTAEDQSGMLWVMSTGQQRVAGSKCSNPTRHFSDSQLNAANPKVAERAGEGEGGRRE
jgi:hypothetical protein